MTASIRHTEATRKVILEAAVALFLERKKDSFSVQEVADRAGVTHRTVYRYFPTRQELLAATAFQIGPNMAEAPFGRISTLEEWVGALAGHYEVAEERLEMVRSVLAAVFASEDLQVFGRSVSDRDTHLWEVFRGQLPNLPDDDATRTYAALRHLTSSTSYVILRLRFRLSPGEATKAIQSAAAEMVEHGARRDRAVKRGRRG
jgi:AcrR family transcriptional regulator